MASVDLSMTIIVGLAMAALGVMWIWRTSMRPSLVEKQEQTLNKQHERMDRMQNELDELRRTISAIDEAYQEELNQLRAVLDEWWHGMERVFEQMAKAELVPVWRPRPLPPKKQQVERPSSALAERIARQFSIDEMNSLAFDIGVLAEEFSGETRDVRARMLVELVHRRGITAALVGRVNELRSSV